MESIRRQKRKKIARTLRLYRSIHRWMGAFLFSIFVFVSLSGLLLGWKKNSGGYIHPKSMKGSSTNVTDWLPLDTLQTIAFSTIQQLKGNNISLDLDRIDARPEKGMIKFIFNDHYYSVQVDATTGEILQTTYRASDLIEDLHDGSIIDRWLGIDGEWFKLIYTSIIGVALFLFCFTGFYLWYGPKRMRKLN